MCGLRNWVTIVSCGLLKRSSTLGSGADWPSGTSGKCQKGHCSDGPVGCLQKAENYLKDAWFNLSNFMSFYILSLMYNTLYSEMLCFI